MRLAVDRSAGFGLLLGVYLAVVAGYVWRRGVPFEREQVVVALTIGLVLVVLARGDGTATVAKVVRDWALLALLFVAYDYTRGAGDTLGMPIWDDAPIAVDKALFAGRVPTVELQQWLGPFRGDRWWEPILSLTYASHFIVPYALTAGLWVRNRSRWRAWLAQFGALTVAGLATYVLAPTTPPWLASRQGLLPPVQRSAAVGWNQLGLDVAERVISKGQGAVNLVAALPSLHAAYALLVSVCLWPRTSNRLRPALVVYPLLMAFTLVITAEHYVFDVLLGWLYVALVVAGWHRVKQQRRVAAWLVS